MSQKKYSLHAFVDQSAQKRSSDQFFELETFQTLTVNLDGRVWAKAGSMIAYQGDIRFKREGMLEHGVGSFLKRTVSGEQAPLMKAEGAGTLFLADKGKQVTILQLQEDSLFVNGKDILAFEPNLNWDIKMMKKISGMMAGGLFNISFEGTGMVAITSHHKPLTLMVKPDQPIYTDPNATIAWSGNLAPEIKTDITLQTLLGRGSGESIQMAFSGEGFVIVQSYSEVYYGN